MDSGIIIIGSYLQGVIKPLAKEGRELLADGQTDIEFADEYCNEITISADLGDSIKLLVASHGLIMEERLD